MTKKAKKKRPAKAKAEHRVRNILLIVLAAIIVFGGIYEIYALNRNPISVIPATEQTMETKVSASAFIFRDEQCIHADLTAYSVPFVQDGDRVPADGVIAANFGDAGSARQFAQLVELRQEHERLSALATGVEYSSVRVSALMDGASDGLCAFLQHTDSGNIASAEEAENNFLEKETALELATGENIDFAAKLSSLSKDIRAQEASVGNYQTISTGLKSSGYFFSKTDGYEDVIPYGDAGSLSVSTLEAALQTQPVSSSGGKIVKEFGWYIAAVVDSQTAEKLSHVNGSLRVNFPQAGLGEVPVTIYAMRADASGKCAVVFRCIENSSELLQLRKEEIEIIFGKATGLRVPLSAVRMVTKETGEGEEKTEEQVQGVYVLRGNVVSFRRINTVYAGEDYILTAPKLDDNGNPISGYLELYEEIITEGKDLRAGAVVYR